jgi:hypothetical protein
MSPITGMLLHFHPTQSLSLMSGFLLGRLLVAIQLHCYLSSPQLSAPAYIESVLPELFVVAFVLLVALNVPLPSRVTPMCTELREAFVRDLFQRPESRYQN